MRLTQDTETAFLLVLKATGMVRSGAAKARGGADYAAPDETDTALLKALDRIAQRKRREALVRADARQEFERAVLAGERPGPVP
ncbi:PleD family two-component response regulator [Sphingomonas sp. BE123]|uniref:hypothetical protein n=1 Tax=Sphingomonas sp. BE123 TaxID=2817842 RepID=UPI0028561C90|nr:hypothetical protein [Sphingomonas sp. BE123]MDR6853264.1 PleD family two-component response regulator [Sphingomonas sp. BE123]